MGNTFITNLIAHIRSEADLAWNQAQTGGSEDAKYEGRQAYALFSQLADTIECDYNAGCYDDEEFLNDYN